MGLFFLKSYFCDIISLTIPNPPQSQRRGHDAADVQYASMPGIHDTYIRAIKTIYHLIDRPKNISYKYISDNVSS